ncbi:MAG: DUF5655 domain-containing protein [archaeon]|nr:DUF5655 domain-containing protein [archaeon]
MAKEESIIVTKDGKYHLYKYINEKELEKMIVEHSSEIFGKNTHYFDIKKKIKSKSGFGTIPDGYLLDFDRKKLYILEVELISHDLRKHILPQIMSFIMALENENSHNQLIHLFEDELTSSSLATKEELKKMLDNYGIIILIDEVGDPMKEVNPLLEIVNLLAKHAEVKAIPFQTYIKGNNLSADHVHSFKSFTKEELEKESKKWTFKWADVSAEKHINKLDNNSKKIFNELREKICNISSDIKEVHRSNWTTFQISKLGNFCTIKFPKGNLEIYLKANKNFKDNKKMTKDIKRTLSWTFDKVFTIKSQGEIDYAISLIEQAYRCICELKNKGEEEIANES